VDGHISGARDRSYVHGGGFCWLPGAKGIWISLQCSRDFVLTIATTSPRGSGLMYGDMPLRLCDTLDY
jgi:hypothetical protein